jgi:hypothetical protein
VPAVVVLTVMLVVQNDPVVIQVRGRMLGATKPLVTTEENVTKSGGPKKTG